ncbi:Calcineurin-like phosphoesterase superfamily domain protein [uncultured archaeon]|nr:Calcineurin-like phosphoesterase superfamily domain protein [uncultured archaeon]
MGIMKNFETIGPSLWLKNEKTLAMSDLHLGYEEMLNSQGVMVPRINFQQIGEALEKNAFPRTGRLEKIIICGDLKHEFGTISTQEWKEVLDMLGMLSQHAKEIILVKGNHDTILGPIASFAGVRVEEEHFLEKEKVLFLHGDKIPAKEKLDAARTIVIGHEHPCITVSDGVKAETYKCFLRGKFRGKNLVVLPSMNFIAIGSEVTREKPMSPLIKNVEEFEVFAVEGKEMFGLGKLKNLARD